MAKAKYDLVIEENSNTDTNPLVMMRFPAMRSQFENPADVINLSFKPKAMKFKMEVELNKRSSSYYNSANVQVDKTTGRIRVEDGVDRNYYTSTKVTNEDGQLFVCKLVNHKLVCQPVSHLITMRSDFSHLDVKDEPDPKEESRPISVKFASTDRQNTGQPKPAQTSRQAEDKEAQEDYVSMYYRPLASKEANLQRIGLFGKPVPNLKPDPGMLDGDDKSKIILMPDIKPKVEPMDEDEEVYSVSGGGSQGSTTSTTTRASAQKSAPAKTIEATKRAVRECLLKAKIVSFPEVYNCVRNQRDSNLKEASAKDILDALGEYAILVQGNWAVKSETLYGGSVVRDSTDVTGISVNLFISARDYLLYLFDQNRLVSRLEFSRKVHMPDHDVLDLFKQLAIFKPEEKKWELKLPTDRKFLEHYPDVVLRQQTFWKVRRANKLAIFKA